MILISLALPLAIALYSHELSSTKHSIDISGAIAQIPLLFSDVLNRIRFASTANEEPDQAQEPEPVPMQMPAPKEPEPVAVEAEPKEAEVGANGRFHGLDPDKRAPLVKSMKKEHGYTNKKLSVIFDVNPATISRDLNSQEK